MSNIELKSLENALQYYQNNLDKFEKISSDRELTQIGLKLLRSRDAVEKQIQLQDIDDSDNTYIELIDIDQKLSKLDRRLKKAASRFANKINLSEWRQRLAQSEEAWWWNIEISKTVSLWDRFDWLWDFITLIALAISASFMFMIFKSLSVGDFSIIETFSTIAQVAGLAVLSQGALTQTGREKVSLLLIRLNLPSKFHSEALLLISLILLGIIYFSHYKLNIYYTEEGRKQYQQGLLSQAELTYLRGLEIDPEDKKLHTALGKIHESLGNLKEAVKQYSISTHSGELEGVNNLGRSLINYKGAGKNPEVLAEAFLLLGFQHAELENDDSEDAKVLRYQLSRNLGWATLKQKKYDIAEYFLKKAIRIDESIPESQQGSGMAYCFLAHVYDQKDQYAQQSQYQKYSDQNWLKCLHRAHPETIYEYKWLLEIRKDMFASCIDTSHIVTIEARADLAPNILDQVGRCKHLSKKLKQKIKSYESETLTTD
jgi:Tfp pilus assembly protein PilF